ncbi:MAG: LysM peptidoglycan-binding domain-containing protein [Bacillota bacterium]|nr:LysM peptidoglycan-binding domain-containing protein [Bacillota bacterium]
MARNTRLATTITARYTASVGAVDAFYMDGRSNSRREMQFADLTLDREERGSFFAVYASSHGVRDASSGDDGNRDLLNKICDDMKRNKHRNIDEEINDLAECAVNVAGRLTLSDGAVRQPYFAGIIVKDGEMAAITLGRGCCYLHRDNALYQLTQDDFPLEPVDHFGRRVNNMDDFAAGVAGTIRYSNIAQLKPDDSIILCNREVMEAIGQHQMLRILHESEDQAEAAGTVMDIATEELQHVSLQFMIGYVEDVITIDRLGRSTLARGFAARSSGRLTAARQERDSQRRPFADEPRPERDASYTATGYGNDREAAPSPGSRGGAGAGDALAGAAGAYEGEGLGLGRQAEPGSSYRSFYGDETAQDDRAYERLPEQGGSDGQTAVYDYGHGWNAGVSGEGPAGWAQPGDEPAGDGRPGAETDKIAAAWKEFEQDETRSRILTPAKDGMDPELIKRIAVIGLAVIAVILLFFIVRSLIKGPAKPKDGTESSQVTPGSSTTGIAVLPGDQTTTTGSSVDLQPTTSTLPPPPQDTTTIEVIITTQPPTDTPTTPPTTQPTTAAPPPPTTQPTAAPTAAPTNRNASTRNYTVSSGDSFWSIANNNYDIPDGQTMRFIEAILAANGFANINATIMPGDVITLPPVN